MKKKCNLFHITAPSNVESILKQGLIAKPYDYNGNEGVFLFEDKSYVSPYCFIFNLDGSINPRFRGSWMVADHIASRQIGIDPYALFEVEVDAEDLLPDNVGEEVAKFQFIYPKDISPKALTYKGIYEVVPREEMSVYDLDEKCFLSTDLSKMLWKQTHTALERIVSVESPSI